MEINVKRRMNMAVSRKTLREQVKAQYMAQLMEMLGQNEDVGITASNEFNFPVVDAEGNEDFIVVKLVIPTGTREGDEYDGYGARNDYSIKMKEKAEKAAKAAEAKAKKIARDAKARAKKAEAKA